MDGTMIAIIINLGLSVFIIGGYSYLSVAMAREAIRPKDWLTPLRWRIFTAVFFVVLTLIPSFVYQLLRLYGLDTEEIRNVVTVTSRINSLGALLVLFSVFTYRRKGDK